MVKVLDKRAASPPHPRGSIVFARWRQCATHASLGQSEYTTQMASRTVQPFLQSSQQNVPILYNRPRAAPFPLKIAPSYRGSAPPSNTWFLEPTRVHNPNGISIGSSVFAGLRAVTDWQTVRETERATRSITICGIYVLSTAMQPKNMYCQTNTGIQVATAPTEWMNTVHSRNVYWLMRCHFATQLSSGLIMDMILHNTTAKSINAALT